MTDPIHETRPVRETPASSQPTQTSAGRLPTPPASARRPQTSARFAPRTGRLASARDRQRLQERRAEERARVERMLASAPVPVERRSSRRARSADAPATAPQRRSRGLQALPAPGCPVCGSGKTVTDEVFQSGTLLLSECLHCEHRWTARPRGRWAELGATMSRGSRSAPARVLQPA